MIFNIILQAMVYAASTSSNGLHQGCPSSKHLRDILVHRVVLNIHGSHYTTSSRFVIRWLCLLDYQRALCWTDRKFFPVYIIHHGSPFSYFIFKSPNNRRPKLLAALRPLALTKGFLWTSATNATSWVGLGARHNSVSRRPTACLSVRYFFSLVLAVDPGT